MTTIFPVTRMLDAALQATADGCQPADCHPNFTPRADVLEGENEYRIVMDLPGVAQEDLEINLEKQALTVKAAKTAAVPEGFSVKRNERAGEMQLSRTFNLGNSVDGEKISAALDKGVLQISLPKSETSLPRRIEVK